MDGATIYIACLDTIDSTLYCRIFFYLIFVFVLGKLDEIDQKEWFPSEKLPTLKNTLGHGMQLPSIL